MKISEYERAFATREGARANESNKRDDGKLGDAVR